jgi:hypothetical protein
MLFAFANKQEQLVLLVGWHSGTEYTSRRLCKTCGELTDMSNLNPENKWKKGQSGNPKGRPRKVFNVLREWDERLLEVDPDDPKGRTHGAVAMDAYVLKMKQGSIRLLNEYLDRKLGKPPQAIAIADMRTETREQLIANILENARALRDDESETIQ